MIGYIWKFHPLKVLWYFVKRRNLVLDTSNHTKLVNLSYQLDLPIELSVGHAAFHISMLKKFMGNPSKIIKIEDIGINDNLPYEVILAQILDRHVCRSRTKIVESLKFLVMIIIWICKKLMQLSTKQ